MPPVGFEPAILASERPQTSALDRAATGIGRRQFTEWNNHQVTWEDHFAEFSTIDDVWFLVNAGYKVRVSETPYTENH